MFYLPFVTLLTGIGLKPTPVVIHHSSYASRMDRNDLQPEETVLDRIQRRHGVAMREYGVKKFKSKQYYGSDDNLDYCARDDQQINIHSFFFYKKPRERGSPQSFLNFWAFLGLKVS